MLIVYSSYIKKYLQAAITMLVTPVESMFHVQKLSHLMLCLTKDSIKSIGKVHLEKLTPITWVECILGLHVR